MKKLFDLAVVTGQYQDRDGATRRRYQNVGGVFQNDDGGQFVVLSRSFNPAGVPFRDGKDSIVIGCFEPRESQGGGRGAAHGGGGAGGTGGEAAPARGAPAPNRAPAPHEFDDDIPF